MSKKEDWGNCPRCEKEIETFLHYQEEIIKQIYARIVEERKHWKIFTKRGGLVKYIGRKNESIR